MIRESFVCVVILCSFFLAACSGNSNTALDDDAPPVSIDSSCFRYTKNAHDFVSNNDLVLVIDIDYDSGGNLDKRLIYDSLSNSIFSLRRTRVYDSFKLNCFKPIMDSAIISLYGDNAIDSITQLLYQETERIYKQQRRK